MNITLQQAADFFRQNDNFVLICHANPDGDTLGSGYALCGVLHSMGKYAKVLCADEPSPRFDYLKDTINPELLEFTDTPTEMVVTVDVADLELLGDLQELYSHVDLCIDHHVSNKFYAERSLLDTEAAACAELVWDLIKVMVDKSKDMLMDSQIGKAIAAAIYTGVSTDTGCFRYTNTTAKSHVIAAELMVFDFDVSKINYLMFEMKTRERIELERKAYSGIEYYFGGKCAIITLTAAVLEGIDPADSNNVSVLPKQVEGVEAGVIIKEKDTNTWKISVRTNRNINAQAICAELGGGGHFCAAGCKIKGSLDTVKNAVLQEIEKQIV
jgi:phosphoesterase RecJ-like protein